MRGTAIVSGASGAIGRAICSRLTTNAWTVIGLDLDDSEADVEVEDFITCDVAKPETWETVAKHRLVPELNIVVNNAAVQLTKELLATSSDEWDRSMAVNVRSMFLSIHTLAPMMSSGSFVNVSSVHAVATSVGLGAYAASKGAVSALTRAAALELAPRGIRVNAVMPGATDSAMLRSGLAKRFPDNHLQDLIAGLSGRHPIGRIARPDEIASAVAFLAAEDQSGFINGETLVVDGGALAQLSTE